MKKTILIVSIGLLSTVILQLRVSAQTAIQGRTKVYGYGTGALQINYPFSQNVQIMAYNPPPYSSSNTSDYYYFINDVMNQPYVDGVTLELDWANIEEPLPTTPCGSINSDVCQLDAVGVYHQYSWSNYDTVASLPSNPLGILQWFGPFNGVQTYKQVNFVLAGINASGINLANGTSIAGVNMATPWYVTSTGYAANFRAPYNRQDVMNTVLDCSSMPWTGITNASYSVYTAISNQTALVNWPGCCNSSISTALHSGDTVWVTSNTATNYQTPQPTSTAPGGATITVKDNDDFYYMGTGPLPTTCTSCTFITTSQSTPVPYELPYVTAWEAFMAAANLHYNPNYTVSGIGVVGPSGTNQLGYVRSGTWVGGESFPECITNPGGGTNGPQNGLTGLATPYNFVTSPNTWLVDYQNKVSYVQSLNPTMQRLWPIDNGVPTDSMTPIATGAGNGVGYINGFGSQGLSLLDIPPPGSSCSPGSSAADWCNEFVTYYARGMPLELQQIAISNPDVSSCSGGGSACGTPPKVSGDMRVWLPFAVQKHATIMEVYYQDLGLAFDPSYCNNGGSHCYHLPPVSGYTGSPAYTWYCEVGYGAQHAYNGCSSGGCTMGGCYSQTIIAEHGLQQ